MAYALIIFGLFDRLRGCVIWSLFVSNQIDESPFFE
jgi:hypothetical protein